jgi:hypothetical protein
MLVMMLRCMITTGWPSSVSISPMAKVKAHWFRCHVLAATQVLSGGVRCCQLWRCKAAGFAFLEVSNAAPERHVRQYHLLLSCAAEQHYDDSNDSCPLQCYDSTPLLLAMRGVGRIQDAYYLLWKKWRLDWIRLLFPFLFDDLERSSFLFHRVMGCSLTWGIRTRYIS